ncbi:endolytic transglycosylase MltG [Mailhella massiliensis]|uniref:Endolytic murein transglycosylase n=1 Tax=Mailhella massiliensis TaxID=1903261 RepID=A0A921AV39_9BACT|nr:endolytic transglycosylase MltG [Mailhella massiliensis]HJD96912.1 endolytic transglycosylase MltG [Mailhella massiliensis]
MSQEHPSPTPEEKENTQPQPETGQDSQPSPVKKKGHMLRNIFLLVFLLMLCAGLYVWHDARSFLDTAPETPGTSLIVDIEPGMTLAQVADMLQKKGVVTNSLRFQLLTMYKEKSRSLQAGRFLVHTGWLPEKVLDMLVSGKTMLYRLTIREGLPWWDVARLVEEGGFCKASDFTSVIHDPEFLRHWGIPFDSAEGFLFPETYLLPRPREMNREAARAVANRLVEMFWKRADSLWPDKKRPPSQELKKLVILASIVEKETGLPEERARVAGVYVNRLKRDMLLQADPTVIYGLGRAFEGPLLKKHLENEHNRYNTYQNPGLPPGPICSFGTSALKAAINPEKHEYLYFVATGRDRGHTFSKTLAEHNRAVREYRAALRRNKK